jgi:hypothetical protein
MRALSGLRTPLLVGGAAALFVATTALPASALSSPEFQMPFACGETWHGSTRSYHSPSPYSIDWTRDSHDYGHSLVASAPGTVTSVINLGGASYGLYVVVDHGGGWTSLYAHLSRAFVVAGQHVDQGQTIGQLGDSGDATGPHLHFEERLNKVDQHASFNRVSFVYNSWLKSADCVETPVAGDWNGDRRSDVGTFWRKATTAVFKQRYPDGSRVDVPLGAPTNQPVVGDWDGNGESDLGVWAPVPHKFTLDTGGVKQTFSFGNSADVPVTGDWDGDGLFDVGVWNPATATFLLRSADGTVSSRVFGATGDLPITGDWNGDGRWDVGSYDPTTSTFRTVRADGTTRVVTFGAPGDLPVVGFFNAGGVSDLGVWDPATATFSERLSARKTAQILFGTPR